MSSGKRERTRSTASLGEAAASRANLAVILFCFLAIVSTCLTIFNMYIFVWIWSSLSSSGPTASSNLGANQRAAHEVKNLNLLEQLEMMRDESKLTFGNKLVARKPFQVARVKQYKSAGATLRISSKKEVQFKINATGRHKPVLVVAGSRDSSRDSSLDFAGGLVVRSEGRAEPALECKPPSRGGGGGGGASEPFCLVRARQIALSRSEGVDFGALKTIETSLLRTRRVHSSLNKLQLMAGGAAGSLIELESRNDQVHLRALDLVALGSRNSTVIIRAKTIKLGDLVQLSRGADRQLAKQHKLCVCLRGHQEQESDAKFSPDDDNQKELATNNGLVFAIQGHLKCSQFGETFCAPGRR